MQKSNHLQDLIVKGLSLINIKTRGLLRGMQDHLMWVLGNLATRHGACAELYVLKFQEIFSNCQVSIGCFESLNADIFNVCWYVHFTVGIRYLSQLNWISTVTHFTLHGYRIDAWAIRRPWLTFVNALANSTLGRFYTARTQRFASCAWRMVLRKLGIR